MSTSRQNTTQDTVRDAIYAAANSLASRAEDNWDQHTAQALDVTR